MRRTTPRQDQEMFGKLGSLSLHDLVQMLHLARRSVTLTLRRRGQQGRIYFRDGEILHASAGPFTGEDGVLELLQWSDAEFEIEEGGGELPDITIAKNFDELLLGTLTKLDESTRHGVAPEPSPAVTGTPARRSARRPPRPRKQPRPRTGVVTVLVTAGLLSAAALLLGATGALDPIAAPWNGVPAVASESARSAASSESARSAASSESARSAVGSESARSAAASSRPDAWAVLSSVDQENPAMGAVLPRVVAASSPPPEAVAATPVPSASAPAASELRGALTVVAEPWARIRIDGVSVGETPLGKLELEPGAHRIVLENDHVVGVIQDDVVLGSGETLTRRYSFHDVGFVRFVAVPWADVAVDGRSVGQTPLAELRVPAGRHTVRFTHPEFGQTERVVDVTLGESTLVRLDWRSDRR